MTEKTKAVRYQRLEGREDVFDLFRQVAIKILCHRHKSN
jgi:hypothetical protein